MPLQIPVCLDVPDALAPRARYALDELLRGLGLSTQEARRDDAEIVVSDTPTEGALWLPLRAAAWHLQTPDVADLGRLEVDGERWPLPVGDVLASTFWWLAGVQEAATAERDRHGRFPFSASLQARLTDGKGMAAPGTALRPAVDAYRRWLAGALRDRGVSVPARTWGAAPWAVALTHDVDALDAGRLRGLAGEVARGRPAEALRRAVGPNRRRESVARLAGLARRHGVRSTLFVKAGATAPEDVPYRLGGQTRQLLRNLASDGFEIGLHPSYGAADHPARLAAERDDLEAAVGRQPTSVRTHFLRWLPPTLPLLDGAGFEIDSTLGFSEAPGFRRGTAHPFRLYDLGAERATDLWEMPLALMDTTLFTHQGLSDDDALASCSDVLGAAQAAGGVAVVLWHSFVGGAAGDRTHILDHLLGEARACGARIGPLRELLSEWLSPTRSGGGPHPSPRAPASGNAHPDRT